VPENKYRLATWGLPNNRGMDDDLEAQHRLREFTLLLAQIAARYDMSEGELAAAAGGACAVNRLLRRTTALEQGEVPPETPPEALVMIFDARMRLPVVVQGPDTRDEGLALAAPQVAYQ
jgi:hypothetical protein